MFTRLYYRLLDKGDNNIEDDSRHLIVNCCGVCVLDAPFVTNVPSGRHDFYLQYLIKGQIRALVDGKEVIMHPGEVMVYFPHTHYCYRMHGNEQVEYLWAHFTGRDAQSLMDSLSVENRTVVSAGIRERVIVQFEELFREFIIKDGMFLYSSAARLTLICAGLFKAGASDSQYSSDTRVTHTLDFIHRNYQSPITVEQLAAAQHVSAGRLRTLFRRVTGMSPMDYLITLRINQAMELIVGTNLSIKEVAAHVGFSDQLYFSRIFKQRTGKSPREYKVSAG